MDFTVKEADFKEERERGNAKRRSRRKHEQMSGCKSSRGGSAKCLISF